MEISQYFRNIEAPAFPKGSLGESILIGSDSIEASKVDVAIFTVNESRWNEPFEQEDLLTEKLLKALGSLHIQGVNPKVAYLGALILGASAKDTEVAVSDIVEQLMNSRIVPLIISATSDLNKSIYNAFKNKEQALNLTTIDPFLRLNDSKDSYLHSILQEQPNYLFNFSNIGYQTYYNSESELQLANDLFFDVYRLGLIRGSIHSSEPIIRGAEFVALSMNSIKRADFSSSQIPQPNGFSAEEMCQMMRYSGLSENSQVVNISDIVFNEDCQPDNMLLAQMIWCFVEAFYARRKEMPGMNSSGFLKYRISLRDDEFHLVFYKSLNTDRWWMEVPVPPQYTNRYRKHYMVPCSYEDYHIATQDDLPERWWKTYKKML